MVLPSYEDSIMDTKKLLATNKSIETKSTDRSCRVHLDGGICREEDNERRSWLNFISELDWFHCIAIVLVFNAVTCPAFFYYIGPLDLTTPKMFEPSIPLYVSSILGVICCAMVIETKVVKRLENYHWLLNKAVMVTGLLHFVVTVYISYQLYDQVHQYSNLGWCSYQPKDRRCLCWELPERKVYHYFEEAPNCEWIQASLARYLSTAHICLFFSAALTIVLALASATTETSTQIKQQQTQQQQTQHQQTFGMHEPPPVYKSMQSLSIKHMEVAI